jgi:hypothetical protein
MTTRHRYTALLLGLSFGAAAHPAFADDGNLQASLEELRHVVGEWATTTEEIDPDGNITRTLQGTYRFDWVIPDRVLSGRSDVPELGRASAILFYVSETKDTIEMVSVAADGRLWVMTGELGGNTRYTEPYPTGDGGTGQLRFTRYNVSDDSFESKMEYSSDGGNTWTEGNHQVFRRIR